MNDYNELLQTIKAIEDTDVREKLLVGVEVLTENHTVRLRELADSTKILEKKLKMLKTFKVVAVAYMNDVFLKRRLAGEGNQALLDIFHTNMKKYGYELVNGEWEEVEKQ